MTAEHACLALAGTVCLTGQSLNDFLGVRLLMSITALSILMATFPSQNADIEFFSSTDGSLEVTSYRATVCISRSLDVKRKGEGIRMSQRLSTYDERGSGSSTARHTSHARVESYQT